MILVDEDGPLEKIPLWRFPVSRGNRHMFESLAAPVSRELDRHADQIGSTSSEVQYATRGDVDGDFARTIPGAVAEIAGQLGSEADVDPGRMLAAALEAMGEADGVSAAAASDASAGSVSLAVGGSEFEIVQWQIAGAGAPPPSSHGPPPPGDSGEPPPSDQAPPPPTDGTEPPPSDQPPPPPPPQDAGGGGGGEPSPPDQSDALV